MLLPNYNGTITIVIKICASFHQICFPLTSVTFHVFTFKMSVKCENEDPLINKKAMKERLKELDNSHLLVSLLVTLSHT